MSLSSPRVYCEFDARYLIDDLTVHVVWQTYNGLASDSEVQINCGWLLIFSNSRGAVYSFPLTPEFPVGVLG
jgi:hypothetical protein